MDFASTVKELRKRCLLSQMDFAKEIGVSFSTVNRWETVSYTHLTLPTILRV